MQSVNPANISLHLYSLLHIDKEILIIKNMPIVLPGHSEDLSLSFP